MNKTEIVDFDMPVKGVRPVKRLVVIGLGLIGGSFALAMRRARLVHEVVAVSQNPDTLEKGKTLGVIDRGTQDYADALRGAELVFIATPMGAFESVLRLLKPHLSDDMVITDGGSVKAGMLEAVLAVFGRVPPNFVLGHPIAGSEDSGITAARADLFDDHKVILTPIESTSESALHWVRELWIRLGSEVHFLDPERHDQILAFTSHLPHLLAYSLVDTLGSDGENREIFRYAAGGFRDFTRIAASDPVMWRDIFLTNRQATLKAIDAFQAGLNRLRAAVDQGDGVTMAGVFTRARASRRHFSKMLKKETWRDQPEKPRASVVVKARRLRGVVGLSGDQSISHRAILLAALSHRVWEIRGVAETEDNIATIQALRDMGVVIEEPGDDVVRVRGVGLGGLKPPPGPLYMGGSTTVLLLFSGLLAGQRFSTEMVGNEALLQHPVVNVTEPLSQMGVAIESAAGHPPLLIHGGFTLKPIHFRATMPSARVKTALLLAALYARGESEIIEPVPTRDHTERLMMAMGFPVMLAEQATDNVIRVNPEAWPVHRDSASDESVLTLPGDGVLAFYIAVAVALSPDSEVIINKVTMNKTRMEGFDTLLGMSASMQWDTPSSVDAECVANLHVQSSRVRAITLGMDSIVRMKQEIPGVMLAAAMAEGTSVFKGLDGLSGYRSDVLERMKAMSAALTTLGVNIVWAQDTCTIIGNAGRISTAANDVVEVDAGSNPLISLALLLSCSLWPSGLAISGVGSVFEDYPSLPAMLRDLGIVVVQ